MSKKVSKLPYFWETDITGHVWWRVSAYDKNHKLLERSKIRRLTIAPPPPIIDISELDGYYFSWDSTQAVSFYRFKISKKPDFEPSFLKVDLKDKSYSLENIDPGTYYWKVGAKFNRQIPIVYSEVRKLVVAKGVTEEVLTSVDRPSYKKVDLNEPSSLKSSKKTYRLQGEKANISLQWKAVKKATSYQVLIGDKTDLISLDNGANLSLGTGSYKWKVRAVSAGGNFGPWSESSKFEVVAPKKKLTLTSPANKSTNKEFLIDFEWEKTKDCSEYTLIVSSTVDFSEIIIQRTLKNNKYEWDVEDEGEYYWYVKCSAADKSYIGSNVREIDVYE